MYSTYNALHALHLILLKEIVILLFNPIHTGGVLNQHTPIHFLPVFLQFSID